MDIIVIGNGPSNLQNEFGEIIDSFTEVVRINHYKPEMKKYVGEKVTIYTTSSYKTQFYESAVNKANEILIWDEKLKKTCYDKYDKTKIISRRVYKTPVDNHIPMQPITDKLKKDHGFNVYPKNPWCSTGIGILMYLIQTNKYKKIYITGFDGIQKGQQEHYFSNVVAKASGHSTTLENDFIKYYIDNGILVDLKNSELVKS